MLRIILHQCPLSEAYRPPPRPPPAQTRGTGIRWPLHLAAVAPHVIQVVAAAPARPVPAPAGARAVPGGVQVGVACRHGVHELSPHPRGQSRWHAVTARRLGVSGAPGDALPPSHPNYSAASPWAALCDCRPVVSSATEPQRSATSARKSLPCEGWEGGGQLHTQLLAPHHSRWARALRRSSQQPSRAPPPSRPPLQPRRPWLAGVPSGASWHRHPPPLEPWAGEVRPPPGRRCHRLGGRGSALAPVAIEEAVIRGWKGGPACCNLQQHVQEMGEAMAPSVQRRQPFSHGS